MSDTDFPAPVLLSGTAPGILDPLQRARLLRTSTTKLSFASYDVSTARPSFPDLNGLHINDNDGTTSQSQNKQSNSRYKRERIVIETDTETGVCSWRFVPRARMEQGVDEEGAAWPQVVEISGLFVRMTQDQWDLHKLDPIYDCFYRQSPNHPIIVRSNPNGPSPGWTPVSNQEPSTPKRERTSTEQPTPTKTPRKRESEEKEPDSPKRFCSGQPQTPCSSSPQKSTPLRASTIDTDYDSDQMSIDGDSSDIHIATNFAPASSNANNYGTGTKRRRYTKRLDKETPKKQRRRQNKSSVPRTKTTPSPTRRSSDIFGDWNNDYPTKRSRVHSPRITKRELDLKRLERDMKRRNLLCERLLARRIALQRQFWSDKGIPTELDESELYNFPPGTDPDPQSTPAPDDGRGTSPHTSFTPEEEAEEDGEAARLAKIEESKRKLAELEKDRPIWEESARLRRQKEHEEELARQREKQARDEEKRRQQQAQASAAAYARREERWRAELDAQEKMLHRNAQASRMVVTVNSWEAYKWSMQVAVERYLRLAEAFDAAKFTPDSPPTFASIPWPMLRPSFSLNDIEWEAIENFYLAAERIIPANELREFMDKSHKRFHPDRWRSRRVLASVEDELDRDLLEVAGSTVSQALTPIWKAIMEQAKK